MHIAPSSLFTPLTFLIKPSQRVEECEARLGLWKYPSHNLNVVRTPALLITLLLLLNGFCEQISDQLRGKREYPVAK